MLENIKVLSHATIQSIFYGRIRKANNRVGTIINSFIIMAQNNAILNEVYARIDVTEERPHWCDTD